MAKKQKSFAEKASSSGNKDQVHIKFVKSVPSDREGFWRFNESMISMDKGQNLDAVLKQMEDEANMVDIEMPEVTAEVAEAPVEEAPVANCLSLLAASSLASLAVYMPLIWSNLFCWASSQPPPIRLLTVLPNMPCLSTIASYIAWFSGDNVDSTVGDEISSEEEVFGSPF